MDKLNLHFVSSTTGSIMEITNDLLEPLSKEFNITKEWEEEIPDIDKRDILLLHFYDKEVIESKHFNSFKVKILIQPIDGTSIKEEVVNNFNKFDLIICPGNASKSIMILQGVTVPIEVIPNYYKTDLFDKKIYTGISKYIPTDRIIFYHESTLHPRKGIELLYEGFVKAFSDTNLVDKVILIVKDQPFNNQTFTRNEKIKRDTIKLQKKYKNPAKIIKFSAHLDTDELKDLWNSANIYVSLAKIEGFGIPMLRMFLLDKPIICLENHYSGYNDFLNHNNAYFIPTLKNTASEEFMPLYDENTEWAVPNITAVIETFRKCLIDYTSNSYKSVTRTYVPNAFEGSIENKLQENLDRFSFLNVSKNYIEIIKKYSNFNTIKKCL